jgi:hypothetical protein
MSAFLPGANVSVILRELQNGNYIELGESYGPRYYAGEAKLEEFTLQ